MSSPWMPLYVADYLADTSHLSALEHGAYMLLLMHYWRQGSLPKDDKILARIARLTPREWTAHRGTISAFFDADWKHQRVEKELAKAADKSDRRSEAGSRGGIAKALKNKEATLAKATILPKQNLAKPLASSSQPQSLLDTDVSNIKAPASKKWTRLEPGWRPSKQGENYARAQGYSDADIAMQAERISNWSINAKKNGEKRDWEAAWRNWVLSNPVGKPARGGYSRDGMGEALAEIMEKHNGNGNHEPESSDGKPKTRYGRAGPGEDDLPLQTGGDPWGEYLDLKLASADFH